MNQYPIACAQAGKVRETVFRGEKRNREGRPFFDTDPGGKRLHQFCPRYYMRGKAAAGQRQHSIAWTNMSHP